jgi:DNA repair protein RadD
MNENPDIKTLSKLLLNVPMGFKHSLIGRDVSRSIRAYIEISNFEEDILDLEQMVIYHCGQEILIKIKNRVLFNLINYNLPLKNKFRELTPVIYSDDIFELINNVERKFNDNNKEFCLKVLSVLGLETEYFFPENKKSPVVINKTQTPKFQLHDFQKNIKDRSLSFLLNPENNNRLLVHLPTGAGKTKTAIETICDFIRCRPILGGHRSITTIVWIAHSNELCEQAFESFSMNWHLRGDSEVNTIKFYDKLHLTDQYIQNKSTIVFTSFQKIVSALKAGNQRNTEILQEIRSNIDLFIIDEAHRALATTWNKAILYFIDNSTTQLMGLTATPGKNLNESDNQLLSNFFASNKLGLTDSMSVEIENPINFLRKKQYLAEIESEILFTDFEIKITQDDWKKIKRFGNDVHKDVIANATVNPKRNRILIEAILNEVSEKKKILIFACSVSHCTIIKSLLNIHKIQSDIIVSETQDSRNKVIDNFKNKDLNVLINFGVLTTGFDAPMINTVIIARPTLSIVLYSQMVGRALRGPKNGGNKKNKLITLKDNLSHGNMDDLFEQFESVWND